MAYEMRCTVTGNWTNDELRMIAVCLLRVGYTAHHFFETGSILVRYDGQLESISDVQKIVNKFTKKYGFESGTCSHA